MPTQPTLSIVMSSSCTVMVLHLEALALERTRDFKPQEQACSGPDPKFGQYAMRPPDSADRSRVETVDDDLERSTAGGIARVGFEEWSRKPV